MSTHIISKKSFYKFYTRIFQDIIEEDNCTIPIQSSHQIYVNGILCFLDEEMNHYLFFNQYGQMMIQRENKDGVRENHILFELKDLSSLEFLAKDTYGEINPRTNDYYNTMFHFKLRGEL